MVIRRIDAWAERGEGACLEVLQYLPVVVGVQGGRWWDSAPG